MSLAFIALGANMAGRFASPAQAITAAMLTLDAPDIQVIRRSRLYRSAAWPDADDPEFVNAVVATETDMPADVLLGRLHAIEAEFGRVRGRPNAPRTLDLDLIDYAGRVSAAGDSPILPHPRLADRAFVLLPLAEVAPDWRHPVTRVAIGDLIGALPVPYGASPL